MTETGTIPQTSGYEAIITRELFARMLRHVYVWYWPNLFLNILYIRMWARATKPEGGNGYIAVRFSKFGEIQLKYAGQVFLEDGPEAELDPLAELPSWQRLHAKLISNARAILSVIPENAQRLSRTQKRCVLIHWVPDKLCEHSGMTKTWAASGKKLEPG